MQEWAAVYQRTEDELIKQIASRFWRSKIGGSSVSKAQLVIKTYVRLLAIGLSYFIMNFIAAPLIGEIFVPFITILVPSVMALALYIFCRTDSERKAAYFLIGIFYTLVFIATFRYGGFYVFAIRSHTVLVLCSMLLGVEGLVASFIISTTLGFILMQSEYNGVVHYPPSIGMNEKQRLIHTWTSYETRSMIESLIMIINILKFQETFNQLEQADKHKTEFLCRMSHELRTPLSGIIGSIDILKFAPLTDEYSKLIDMAKACSTNLLQVINDILDFSKIEAGKMKLIMGRVKLRDLVQSSLEVVSPLLGQKPGVESKVVISEDAPDFFTGDLSKLKQILVNLLSNAVKFTSRGSITMQVCMESKQDISRVLSQHNSYVKSWAISAQFIKFSVKDSGLGVAKKDFATIFSAFEQASHRLEENVKSGTGLGLNICLLLVKLMQGAVGITSDGIGHGSAFTFWIPYDKSDEEVIALAGSTSTSSCRSTSIDFGKQVSILLTEDNAVNQVVIKGLLTRLGCTVDIASNGLLAIQKFKKHSTPSYDIILLDLEMPVKDGIETVTELRKMGIKTPIIALTAHAVEEKRTMALKAGMDDFLMKPCSIDTLKQCIERHIVIK